METKKLYFREVRALPNDRWQLIIKLADECKNGHCDFSLTMEHYEKARNHRFYLRGCGAFGEEEIVKHFPNMKPFAGLHNCNQFGEPIHAVANGFYWIKTCEYDVAKRELRITDSELDSLRLAVDADDRKYFAYLLEVMGIFDRWKREADAFIKFLENDKFTWVNPYPELKPLYRLSREDFKDIQHKISTGYYEESEIAKRKEARLKAEYDKKRNAILERYEKDSADLSKQLEIDLYMLDHGISKAAYIYYTHTDSIAFNWSSKNMTKTKFDEFMALPDKPVVKEYKFID